MTRCTGALVVLALLIAGCGQTGDLFLPDAASPAGESVTAPAGSEADADGEAAQTGDDNPDGEQPADSS